jgi:hypothetical protein
LAERGEITKLKGLAIGTVLGAVRDLITQSGAEQMNAKVAEVMDSITVKLGGQPIRGPVLKDNLRAKEEENECNASKIGGAPAATRRQAQTTVVTVGGSCESG